MPPTSLGTYPGDNQKIDSFDEIRSTSLGSSPGNSNNWQLIGFGSFSPMGKPGQIQTQINDSSTLLGSHPGKQSKLHLEFLHLYFLGGKPSKMIVNCMVSVEVLMFAMLSVAFFSLLERKLMGFSQLRTGPVKMGVKQPLADALKLIGKSEILPEGVVKSLYWLSPVTTFVSSLVFWSLTPIWWDSGSVESMVILLILFSVSIYGVIITGWFSVSKFSLIGCSRAVSQSISYEVGLTLIITSLIGSFSTLSMSPILTSQMIGVWNIFPMGLLLPLTLFTILAELNRSPFDLAEGESELVSGFTVEFGGKGYTIVFMAENLALLFSSLVVGVVFMSGREIGWVVIMIMFVMVRCQLPRLRFDKVMDLFWVKILPLTLTITLITLILTN
uniref:NADH-ubiquinone oxidoreductase chain 1 n=1 Tax=Goniodes dissimilis TaxID=186210 RepID=A0A9E9IZI7_9NEOP|nr:NADH dehydrogenase subunit 1 [Goniodes dissimilis]